MDYAKIQDNNYGHKNFFSNFEEGEMSAFELLQLIKYPIWSGLVGMEVRSSILDHVYTKVYVCMHFIKKLLSVNTFINE